MEEGGPRRTTGFFCGRTGLFVLMTGYAFFGALLFKTLEGDNESGVPMQVQRSREDCLRELWLITERLNVLYEKNWTRLVTEQLKRFERSVVESGRDDGTVNPTAPHWTFGGALLYSLTLLTTVGYGRLSPRTSIGKIVAIIYALVGVPLMLILLSALGAMLASGARKIYLKFCCRHSTNKNTTVGYHKAPSSPKFYSKTRHDCSDTASLQIASTQSTPNHVCHLEAAAPKRALLATVRASHTRGRCRQSQVRQLLAESSAHEIMDDSVDELQEHDTPSRIPLIWRNEQPHEEITITNNTDNSAYPPSPTVPAGLVLVIFFTYIGVGAIVFVSTSGWSFLDAVYFCFIAVSTIGIGDRLPQTADTNAQVHLLACCLYIFIGLVIVAMCFSLVHDEIATKCKHIAHNMGLGGTRQ